MYDSKVAPSPPQQKYVLSLQGYLPKFEFKYFDT
jgi:hypothetical protein